MSGGDVVFSQRSKAGFQFISYRERVSTAMDKGLRRNLTKAIKIWHRSLLIQMSGQRTGHQYYVPGTKVKYTASAEGPPAESPAVRTGVLRRSYYTEVSRKSLEAYLGSELDYSSWMERGTPRIAARKSLQPAFQKVADEIAKALAERIDGG